MRRDRRSFITLLGEGHSAYISVRSHGGAALETSFSGSADAPWSLRGDRACVGPQTAAIKRQPGRTAKVTTQRFGSCEPYLTACDYHAPLFWESELSPTFATHRCQQQNARSVRPALQLTFILTLLGWTLSTSPGSVPRYIHQQEVAWRCEKAVSSVSVDAIKNWCAEGMHLCAICALQAGRRLGERDRKRAILVDK